MNSGKLFKEGDSYPIVCDRGYYNTYTYINCVVGPSTYDPYSVPDCLRPVWGCPKVGFPLMKPLLVSLLTRVSISKFISIYRSRE